MIIELALVILIIIMAVTEFLKYSNFLGLIPYDNVYEIQQDCQCVREAFSEDELYKRNVDEKKHLRYWGKLCPNTGITCSQKASC